VLLVAEVVAAGVQMEKEACGERIGKQQIKE